MERPDWPAYFNGVSALAVRQQSERRRKMLETPYHRNDILKTNRIFKAQTLDGHLAVLTRESKFFFRIFYLKHNEIEYDITSLNNILCIERKVILI